MREVSRTVVVAILAGLIAVAPANAFGGEVVVGGYRIAVAGGGDREERCEFRRGGRVVFDAIVSHRLRIGANLDASAPEIPLGADVDENGVPDVVVFGWSGGAHCCFDTWIVECGDSVRIVERIAGGNHEPRLVNLDADPALEAEVGDDVFAYWPASYAGSPSPRVVLDWREGRLVPSCPLTFQAPAADLEIRVQEIQRDPMWKQNPLEAYAGLFREIVHLYYAGQEAAALRLFERARPQGDERGLALLVEMGSLLARSSYWAGLAQCRDESGGEQ